MADHERPAESLEERVEQLRRALDGAADGPDAAWRGYAESLAIGVWEAVGRGDLDAPRRILRRLDALAGWAEDNLPKPATPREEAARGVDQLHRWLSAATEGLARPAAEVHLRRPGSRESAVLKVLFAHREAALTRGQVHKAIPNAERPSEARVSQILDGLVADGLVVRAYGRARGKEEVAHYRLWEAGVELCHRLGLGEPDEPPHADTEALADPMRVLGPNGRRYHDTMPTLSLGRAWG